MKFLDEYRDPRVGQELVKKICARSVQGLRLMEFCGGHTVTIMRNGLRQLLSPHVMLLSGPGCPVCVTAHADLDKAIALARQEGTIIATFGDMIKVPGSFGSLQTVRAEGGDIRVVYSAADALSLAAANPGRPVIFLGIGFETTAPTVAASILEAQSRGLKNYYVLSLHKICPPVIKAILDAGEINVHGIILPGHVSAVIGSAPYGFLPQKYGIGGVIAGFEPLDILLAVDMLAAQCEQKIPAVEIAYRRGVRPEGNARAQEVMETVFETADASWRGIGVIPRSGLMLRKEFEDFDATAAFSVDTVVSREPAGCLCGDILRGVSTPLDCSLFSSICTPENPVGPCMVSSEGACAAQYQYGACDE